MSTTKIDITTPEGVTEVSVSAHSGYSQEEINDIVDALLREGSKINLTYDNSNNTLTIASSADNLSDNISKTGEVTLKNGLAEVSTGISEVDATFIFALGVDDPGSDKEIMGRLYWDDTTDEYKLRILGFGSPTINYDIIRVR